MSDAAWREIVEPRPEELRIERRFCGLPDGRIDWYQRGDLESLPDSGTDDKSVKVLHRPSWLMVPGI
jgi:hypothetical protein